MLEGVQGLGFLLTLIGIGASVWLTVQSLRRRNLWLEGERMRLEDEIAARDARYREFYDAVDAVTRQKAVSSLNTHRPLSNPPPGILPTVQKLLHQEPELSRDPLFFAVGWTELRGSAGVISFTFDGRSEYFSGHIAISGESGYGKGNLAFLIFAQVCLRATTAQAQVFAIDPKCDFSLWKGKAHNWREPVLGRDPAQIRAAMEALRAERERRELLRERFRVLNHEELHDAVRPPTLLVYIAELSVLNLGTDDLDGWLAAEMSTARAAGIRYIIDDQNNSNRSTSYRTHYSTFLAGFQSSQDWVKPNMGMGPEEIRKLGALPPHELPGRGYFTLRNGRAVITMRAPLVDLAAREEVLARLPDVAEPQVVAPLPVEREGTTASPVGAKGRRGEVVVTAADEARILQAADQILARAGASARRVDVCALAFDGATSGDEYQKTKQVLDQHKLLVRRAGAAQVVEVA